MTEQKMSEARPPGSNVVSLVEVRARPRAVPALTDDELIQIREMLADFRKIKVSCPMARRLLDDG